MSDQSIGIFDSGFGGLTVMRAIIKELPQENIIYLADTANLPYGNKSSKSIIALSCENARFLIEEMKVKLLIVACHSASAHALAQIERKYPGFPILGIISAGIDELLKESGSLPAAVIGTRATISSNIYPKAIKKRSAMKLYSKACPLLVSLVEEGLLFHPITRLAIKKYLDPLHKRKIGSLLLACTHFPLLTRALKSSLKNTKIIDPASSLARSAKKLLSEKGLLSRPKDPRYRYFVTNDPGKFQRMGQKFLKFKIGLVEEK